MGKYGCVSNCLCTLKLVNSIRYLSMFYDDINTPEMKLSFDMTDKTSKML